MPAAIVHLERTKDELLLVKDGRLWGERVSGIVGEWRAGMVKHEGGWLGWDMITVTEVHTRESERDMRKWREKTVI